MPRELRSANIASTDLLTLAISSLTTFQPSISRANSGHCSRCTDSLSDSCLLSFFESITRVLKIHRRKHIYKIINSTHPAVQPAGVHSTRYILRKLRKLIDQKLVEHMCGMRKHKRRYRLTAIHCIKRSDVGKTLNNFFKYLVYPALGKIKIVRGYRRRVEEIETQSICSIF